MSDVEVQEKIEVKIPSMYKVLILNDDYTPMDFVIMVLQEIFDKSQQAAVSITLSVHQEGQGICGIYAKDIAMHKSKQVNEVAKAHNFPLKCTVEKE